jgi:hypothetical protein
MAIMGFLNGHQIQWKNGFWEYVINPEPIDKIRSCPRCGGIPTTDGHDSCIANLPGVKNACCGHGVSEGYIEFENGTTIRGIFNID